MFNLNDSKTTQLQVDDTLVSICCLEHEPTIITCNSNSMLCYYEYKNEKFFLTKNISLENVYSNYVKTNINQEDPTSTLKDDSYASFLCIGLKVFNIGTNSRIEFNRTRKNSSYVIVCGTPVCLFFIEYSTGTLIYLIDFKEVSFRKNLNNSMFIMPQTIDFCLVDNKQINAAFLFLFQNEITIVKCADICSNQLDSIIQENAQIIENENTLTVIPK